MNSSHHHQLPVFFPNLFQNGPVCTKNHTGSSTGMESDIIVEGFKFSMNMYGIKFHMLIGDGDSNTYKKNNRARPYNNITVEKI
jgi:ribosomal protein S12